MSRILRCAVSLPVAIVILVVSLSSALRAQPQTKPVPDSQCLECHSQPDLKSAAGRSVFVNEARHKTSVHSVLNCTACHTDIRDFPHPDRVKKVDCSQCHAESATNVASSIHDALGNKSCGSCHGSAHDTRPASSLTQNVCSSCHATEVRDFLASAHGAALAKGDPQSPTCQTCHGPTHRITDALGPQSPVAKKNQPATCGSCHADPGFLAKHQIPFAHPVETYQSSVHGAALSAGNTSAASCSDCHSPHAILPARDVRSSINHWNVPATCAKCHTEIAATYRSSVHGQAVSKGLFEAPVCTDCHGDHAILAPQNPASLVNPSRVSLATCGRCHGDQRLEARYNLPADRVPTFADSFHGLAARSGSQSVANCASCHGVHSIFPSADPRSTVNIANLSRTCGVCHPGAGKAFAIGPVHVGAGTRGGNEEASVRIIRTAYWVIIPLTLGFMLFHHGIDFRKKFRTGHSLTHEEKNDRQMERMNFHFRVAHWLTVVSFPVLVFTGFALKYPESWWARPLLVWESRFPLRATMHRAAAVVLLVSVAYHIVHLLAVKKDRTHWREMIPNLTDLADIGDVLRYNLGLADKRPIFGRFSYVEKIEYFAFLWGTIVMAVTGFILWFNGPALRYLPKWVSDAATALHFYEAVLATCAIAIWHMYTVIFDPDVYPMDRAWLDGKASAEHLRLTRPEYFAEAIASEEAVSDEAVAEYGLEQESEPVANEFSER